MMLVAAWASVGLALPSLVAISRMPLDDLALFSQYCAVGYCSNNLNSSTGAAVACSVGNCPLVEAADTQILYDFDESSSFGDASSFITINSTTCNQLLVLAFRSSHNMSNWIVNLDFVFF